MITFVVYGTPGPQGSKRHVGRGVMLESSKKVKPWRAAVSAAARQAHDGPPLSGPLVMEVTFALARPKSVSFAKRPWPTVYPDLSKLLRSTEDAMTGLIYADDAQIVSHLTRKTYAGDPGSLSQPGAWIHVRPIEGPVSLDDLRQGASHAQPLRPTSIA